MADHNYQRGQTVTVHYPDSRRDSKDARITQLPPFPDEVTGEMVTDAVIVEYENTSLGPMFANISEQVDYDNIEA